MNWTHSDSATLPPWWVDIRTGLENQNEHAILRILLTVSFAIRRDKNKNNMEYEIFSTRQQRLKGELPDTYQYETIPDELRVQIYYIWGKVWGKAYNNDFRELQLSRLAIDAYESIEATLHEEYGVLSLDGIDISDEDEYAFYWTVRNFLLKTEDTNKVIDVIEVSFRYIDQVIREKFYVPNDDRLDEAPDGISPDEAIDQLNRRFRQHSVGYQYESGQIMKVDSQFVHSEVVRPALVFLSDPPYKGANQEFLNAHEHYRNDRYKECLNDCLKAFESCLKIICQKKGWSYSEKDTANRLIGIVFDHDLIDSYMKSHFSALVSTLKSGVPTVRNRLSGHGQGPEEITVPEYIAAYILHLTASNILLLAKADEDME